MSKSAPGSLAEQERGARSKPLASDGSQPSARTEVLCVSFLVSVFLIAGLVANRSDAPFGWDESVYAQRARELTEGAPPGEYWGPVRAPGLPVLTSALGLATGSEFSYRCVPLLFGALGIVLTWLLARHLFDAWSGLCAAALLALVPRYLLISRWFVPDIPGAVVGLAAIAVYAYASRGRRVRWFALFALPLGIAAALLRYGAPIPIGVGLGVLVVGRWPADRTSRWVAILLGASLLSSVVVLLTMPAPLTAGAASPLSGIWSLPNFQRPWWNSYVELTHGLAVYLGFSGFGSHPSLYPGNLFLIVVAAGLTGSAISLVRGRTSVSSLLEPMGMLLVTHLALCHFLPHGEVRYLTPEIFFVVIGATPGTVTILSRLSHRARLAIGMLFVALSLGNVALLNATDITNRQTRVSYVREIARQIRSRLPEPCTILAPDRVPQLWFYSGCEVVWLDPPYSPHELRRQVDLVRLRGRARGVAIVILGREVDHKRAATAVRSYLDSNPVPWERLSAGLPGKTGDIHLLRLER